MLVRRSLVTSDLVLVLKNRNDFPRVVTLVLDLVQAALVVVAGGALLLIDLNDL